MIAVGSQRALAAGLVVWSLLGAATAARADHGPPAEWKVSEGGNGHFYEVIFAGPYDWEGARAVAGRSTHNGLTGYLATLTSAEEQAFVSSLMSPAWSRQYLHIGGVQDPAAAEPDGGWSWITGEPWSYTNWSLDPPEPNNYDGEEHYLSLQSPSLGGRWNDIGGDWLMAGIVIEYGTVPEPTAVTGLVLPAVVGLLCRRKARR
jgi:hypothetical protein